MAGVIALLQIVAFMLTFFFPGAGAGNLLALVVAVAILAVVSLAGFYAAHQTGLARSGTLAGCIALELGAIPFMGTVIFFLLLAGTLENQSARPQAYEVFVIAVIVLLPVLVGAIGALFGFIGGLIGKGRSTAAPPNSLRPSISPASVVAPTTSTEADA